MDPDTFVTAVYVIADDLCREEEGRSEQKSRRGRRPKLSLGEAVALALLAQWHHTGSERAFIRFAAHYWKGCFPALSQSAFNRRMRKLGGVVSRMAVLAGRRLAELYGGADVEGVGYEAADGTVVSLMRRCRGEKGRLFSREEAWIGRGGSDKEWEYGIRLFATASPHGGVTGFAAGPANTGERWLAERVLSLRHGPGSPQPSAEGLAKALGPSHHGGRKGPTGPLWPGEGAGEKGAGVYLADRGFKGEAWQKHWHEDYMALVITRAEEPGSTLTPSQLRSRRQVVETAFHILKDCLGMNRVRARTMAGLKVRIGAKIAALNVALLINRTFGLRPFATFNPIA